MVVAASPWLSRPWRRAAWLTLFVVVAARILTGTILPMELIVAIATGVTVGAAVLVAFGVPDRRMGPDQIAAALRQAGVPVESAWPADVETKGSRPFAATAGDGRRLFVKVLGSDQRDADLLYRAKIGAVYMASSLIAAASPTPGGLGAIEALLVAGLTGVGISPGPAWSAVLTYRLATYWLPVVPGWFSWRLLQRMGYV